MADVNGNEEACIDIFPQNNDSTGNVECGALASQDVNSSIIDPMIVQSEKKEDGMKDVKIRDNVNENSKEKVKMRKKSEKNITLGGTSNEVVEVAKEQKSSKKMASKKMEGSGMIFMCNSKTKKDCYNYKVLGFPGSKRDTVSKIYKGMRLFLFDIDLKLMYGIYKAAGPGGYNLEPKAFSSAYPSQVRFTVLDDCTPLAEEKFRPIIKDNYYTRNKFTCQLTSEQVKKLCKLFQASNKGPKSERPRTGLGAGNHSLVDLARNRLRDWEEKRHQLKPKRPEIYEREALVSPGVTLPQCPLPLYAYDMTSDRDVYRRELPLIENHELRHSDHGRRFQYDVGRGDPYIREPALYRVRLHSVGVPVQYQGASSRSSETHPLHPSHPYRL